MQIPLPPASFRPTTPFHMVWLATDACQLRCLHCSSNSAQRSQDELTTAEAIDLINQLAETGVVDLAISGGEPLLRHDLCDIIAYARSQGLSVGVGTSGAASSTSRLIRLRDSGINRLQVSLDGLANEHEQLRCQPGLFERAVRTIKMGLVLGMRIHVCCTITRLNAHKLELFTDFVARLGVRRLNLSRYVPTGRGTDVLDIDDVEWRAVIERCSRLKSDYKRKLEIVTHLAQGILVDEEVTSLPSFIGCQAGIGQGCVTANGTVLPCVLLPISLGNIRHASFREIWTNSPIVQELQARATLKGKCGACSISDRCGGCRAVAYAKTGDYLQTDPRCWVEVAAIRPISH